MKKVVLISGVTGQDGSYLAELLLEKGYEVHGIIRRSSSINTKRIDHIFNKINLHYGDLTDSSNINELVRSIMPDEIYNLAAQSHVKVSFDVPEYTAQVDGIGTLRFLDAIKNIKPDCRFYQASTSELYGKVQEIPQSETTPFYPRSPYGVAKLYGFWIVKNYRESFGLHASNGILFNHESPRRGETFVTRKITRAVSAIQRGEQEFIELGNMNAKRDWGHAKEYVEAQWRILQKSDPDDFVIATGRTETVRDFVNMAFKYINKEVTWEGEGIDEVGIVDGVTRVKVNPKFYRPAEVELLIGDPTKAKEKLGWEAKITLEELVADMMKYDLENMK